MSQNYTEFPNTDTLSASHTKMIENYKSFRSLNAGTSFPATLLYDGTPCWRTDLNELYIYDGVDTWDLVYAHAIHPGDDFDIDTGALVGAVVVSDIDINLTTDTQGHVTAANAAVNTRTLTLANLGYTGETNATADQTASEILTAIKTVDGENSGLDADLLDGQQGSYYKAASVLDTPVGAVLSMADNGVPTGFLECNGAAISRTTYAALFAYVSTLYGAGNGSTTFNLPDLRGEFIRGWDNGRGVDSGRGIGTYQAQSNSSAYLSRLQLRRMSGDADITVPISGVSSQGLSVDAHSSSGTWRVRATNRRASKVDRPRNRAMMFCIKY